MFNVNLRKICFNDYNAAKKYINRQLYFTKINAFFSGSNRSNSESMKSGILIFYGVQRFEINNHKTKKCLIVDALQCFKV